MTDPDHTVTRAAGGSDAEATATRHDSRPPGVAPPPANARYTLGDEIGRGGMGAVFRATDDTLGREVAVKVLRDLFEPDSGTARRFADEARIAAQLQHPGIPPVHDLGTLPDGRPFLAMKLIKGDTLDDLLKRRPTPGHDRGRFVAVFEGVCQAVGYAHAHGVIHRDLKPQNIMVGAFGEVQVMDWGLAKVLRAGSVSDGSAADTAPETELRGLRESGDDETRAGSVMGTPAYMPPEQAAGAIHKIDARSDVFGLGGVLAVVLTGKPPFTSDSAESTRVMAAQGEVEECLDRLDGCGAEPELVALCKRCLSPRQADRPADAGAVAAAVAAFRADAEARARQAELDRVKAEGETATAEAKAAEGRKRRKVQLALAAAVVLMVAGAGAVAVWRVDEDGKKRAEAVRLEGEERERTAKEAAEAELRAQADRDRTAKAAAAVAGLLDRAEAALRAGDADRAAPFLDQAARRAKDDAVPDHAARLDAYRGDLEVLRALDAVDDFRWSPVGNGYPKPPVVAAKWAGTFAGFGVVPGTTPPAAAAARVNATTVRAHLVAALDGWLARTKTDGAAVAAVLEAADPDPFRSEVRRLLAAADGPGLAALAGRAEWAEQPSSVVQAYASAPAVPVEVRRGLLIRVAAARPGDFGLVAAVGLTYPNNTPAGAAERVRWFQAATALRPRNMRAHTNLAIALHDLRDPAGAAAVYREAIRLDGTYAAPHNGLGNVLRELGQLDAAIAAYRKGIELDATDPLPHANLGYALHDRKDMPGAEAAFRKALELEPKSAPARNGLGNALRGRGKLADAVAEYKAAIALDDGYALPHFNLGAALADLGDPDAAAAAYRTAAGIDVKFAAPHNALGDLLFARGDHAGAAAAYRESIRRDPTAAAPHNGLGIVLGSRGDLPAAEAEFREALRLSPGFAPARDNLAAVLRMQGKPPDAPPPPRKQ